MPKMPKNITTLVGPNNYLLGKSLRAKRDNFTKQYSDLALEVIDGEEASPGQISGSLESVPFLSPKKLLIIKRLSANKQASENIEEILDLKNDTTDLIIVEPKPDKRSSYYKKLQKSTNLEEFKEPDLQTLAKWLVSEAKSLGGTLSFSDANFLVERVGAIQQLLSTELQKLINYDPSITRTSIELLTEASPQGTVFNLLDAAFSGERKKTLKLYESQRAQKIEPQAILAMIVWQLNIVALVSASKKTPNEIAKDTGLHPFVLGKAANISRRLPRRELITTLDNLCQLDQQLKSQSIDADEAVKQLLLELS